MLSTYNKGLIYTSAEDCIDCSKCIRGCPVLEANVSVELDDGLRKMCVAERECILCGKCLSTCVHNARHYRDDCGEFLWDLDAGAEINLIVAPSFSLVYPREYKRVLGWLKSRGVKHIYPAAFGADIAMWGYAKFLEDSDQAGYIAQPCPSVVSYIEANAPQLLPRLVPVQSPMMCTAIYIKKYLGVSGQLAFISPCVAKKAEMTAPRGMGMINYNVTYNSLMRHIHENDVVLNDYLEEDFRLLYGMGAALPMPGGIRTNLEYYLGNRHFIMRVEGIARAYDYLQNMENNTETPPKLIDILNCEHGCPLGTGTFKRTASVNDIAHRAHLLRRERTDTNLTPAQRLQELDERFKLLHIRDFMCGYQPPAHPDKHTVTEQEIEAVFSNTLMKLKKNDRYRDCSSCGYTSCYRMAKAIALGINHYDNCVNYVKNALTQEVAEKTASEAQLRAIIDAMPLAALFFDEDAKMVNCNAAALRLFEMDTVAEFSEYYPRLSPDLQPDGLSSEEKALAMFRQAQYAGHVSFEWQHLTKAGTPLPAAVSIVPMTRHDGYYAIVFIADMRNIDAALKREMESAEANRAKTRFLARMSHEIRTPISAVMGIAEVYLRKHDTPPQIEEAFGKIYDSSKMLLGIVNDILDFSRAESGRLPLKEVAYRIDELVADAAHLQFIYKETKNVTLSVKVDAALPRVLVGDILRIRQVLTNLLTNAYKFTEEGNITYTVQAERTDEELYLILSVRDSGIGMSAQQIAELKGDFVRLHEDVKPEIGGTGLGLPIVLSLVKMMNGKVELESEAGEGTLVTVRIPQGISGDKLLGPLRVSRLENLEVATWDEDVFTVEPVEVPGGHVLVVDDVDTNLYVAEAMLVSFGLTVDICESGETALRKIRGGATYDIIFMDQMMPGLSGSDTTRILRQEGYTRPIVALTANAMNTADDLSAGYGFSGFMTKPIDYRLLQSYLVRFLT